MSFSTDHNPIQGVREAGSSSAYSSVKCPSSYTYKLEDVSESDAGRTEDVVMHKKRIGQVVGIELSWKGVTTDELHEILNTFNPEYIQVQYVDPYRGTTADDYIVTDVFYVGNRNAPMYSSLLGRWTNVSFNLIRRDGVI